MRRLALAFVASALACAPTAAQSPGCAPWPVMRDLLAERYGEQIIGGGVVSDTVVVQVLAAPEGATFTVVTIRVDGSACMIASGTDWDPGVNPGAKEGSF